MKRNPTKHTMKGKDPRRSSVAGGGGGGLIGRRGRLDSLDAAIVKQNAWPHINFVFVAAFMVVVFLGILVGMVFLGVFIGFSYTKEEGTAYKSLKAIGDTMTKAVNISSDIVKAFPPVNFTNIAHQTFPQSDDEWANITTQFSRTSKKALFIVDKAEETDFVSKLSMLSETIVKIVTNNTFVWYVNRGIDHAYWVMEVLQSEDARVLGKFAVKTIKHFVHMFTQSTEEAAMKRELFERYTSAQSIEHTMNELFEIKHEFVKILKETSKIIEKANEKETMDYATELLKDVREHRVVETVVSIIENVETTEEKIEKWARPLIRVVINALADINTDKKE